MSSPGDYSPIGEGHATTVPHAAVWRSATPKLAFMVVLSLVGGILFVTRVPSNSPPNVAPPAPQVAAPALHDRFFFSSAPSCPASREPETTVLGACNDKCSSFSFSATLRCNKKDVSARGCRYRLCDGGSWHCYAKQNAMTDRAQVCANDTLRFQHVGVTQLQDVRFGAVVVPTETRPRTDVYFLVDASAGMRNVVTELRHRASDMLAAFGDGDLAFGVGIFRDEFYGAAAFRHELSLTPVSNGGREKAAKELAHVVALGGGDFALANLVALMSVADEKAVGWRKDASRHVVYIGSAPGHEPSCVGSHVLLRGVVSDALRASGVRIHAVDVGKMDARTTGYGCEDVAAAQKYKLANEGRGQTSAIAKATGGSVATATGKTLVAVVAKVAKLLPTVSAVDVDDRSCLDVLKLRYEPMLPVIIKKAGEEKEISVSVSAKTAYLCELGGNFQCSIKFVNGAQLLGYVNIEVIGSLGCTSS